MTEQQQQRVAERSCPELTLLLRHHVVLRCDVTHRPKHDELLPLLGRLNFNIMITFFYCVADFDKDYYIMYIRSTANCGLATTGTV